VWRRFGRRSLAARPNGRRALWRESQAARTGRARRLRAQTKTWVSGGNGVGPPFFFIWGLELGCGFRLILDGEFDPGCWKWTFVNLLSLTLQRRSKGRDTRSIYVK
jgi:hypothetical protein